LIDKATNEIPVVLEELPILKEHLDKSQEWLARYNTYVDQRESNEPTLNQAYTQLLLDSLNLPTIHSTEIDNLVRL